MTALGKRFATAIAERDRDALTEILADDIDFKGLTPKRFWEAASSDEVLDILFANWFEESDHIDALTVVEEGADVADVHRVGYRFDLTTPDGPHVVEQQAYYRESGDRMEYMRVVCSGYRPRT